MFKLHAKDALVEQNDHPNFPPPSPGTSTYAKQAENTGEKKTGKMNGLEKVI